MMHFYKFGNLIAAISICTILVLEFFGENIYTFTTKILLAIISVGALTLSLIAGIYYKDGKLFIVYNALVLLFFILIFFSALL